MTIDERVTQLEAELAAIRAEIPKGSVKRVKRQLRALRRMAFDGLERIAERGSVDSVVAAGILARWRGEKPAAKELEDLGVRKAEESI